MSPAYVCGEYLALFWVHMGLTKKNISILLMQDLLQAECAYCHPIKCSVIIVTLLGFVVVIAYCVTFKKNS